MGRRKRRRCAESEGRILTELLARLYEALACARPRCACQGARRGVTHCPAHADRSPSLGVRETDGRVLLICRAGCAQGEVLAALQARGLWGGRPADARARRPITDAERARRDVLAQARRARARLEPYAEAFAEADSLRIAWRACACARHVATALGDCEAAWRLLAHAAALDTEARNAEAPHGRL